MFSQFPDIMTINDVKDALGVCRTNAYRLVRSGRLKSFMVGKAIRVPKRALIEFVCQFGCFEVETDKRSDREGGSANESVGQLTD